MSYQLRAFMGMPAATLEARHRTGPNILPWSWWVTGREKEKRHMQ